MKILNVNMTLDPVLGGGTAERTSQISRFFAKAGMECTILTICSGLVPGREISLEGVRIVKLPCLLMRYWIPRFSFRKIISLVKEADIIHLMGHWTFLNALLFIISEKLNKPYVVCPAGALLLYGRSRVLKEAYNLFLGYKMIRRAAGHIAIAPNEFAHFAKYGVGAEKVSLIPNGVDHNDFSLNERIDFRQKHDLPKAPFLLFAGRLNSIKGPDLLMRAFSNIKNAIPDYHIVFAGPDSGMRVELENLRKKLSLQDKVHFVGYLGKADKTAAYREAELLVIPSRHEAMSIVVLEAGISGKPVLITDQCGFNDIAVINGGLVVEASVKGIERGLVEALRDSGRLQVMGRNLKIYVEDNFTWKIAVDKYLKLYNKILGHCCPNVTQINSAG